MKTSGTGRVLATLLIGMLFGGYKHYGQMLTLRHGRDAYLAGQGLWFDRIAAHHSAGGMLIAGVILATVAVVLYELVAAGFTRMIPPSTLEE